MPRSVRSVLLATGVVVALAGTGCSSSTDPQISASSVTNTTVSGASTVDSAQQEGEGAMAFTLTSTAFSDGATIPVEFTCDGENVSPPLAWSGVPAGANALALLMDDPDAPTATPFVHWVVTDIDPASGAIAQGGTAGVPGTNGAGKVGYFGPCPPPGSPHTYHFRLYALQVDDPTAASSTAPDVATIQSLAGSALATAELTGTYQRAG